MPTPDFSKVWASNSPLPEYTFSDADYSKQTEYDYVNIENTWSSATGKNITVAILDTGIDTDHPEFVGRISEYSYNASEDKIVKYLDIPIQHCNSKILKLMNRRGDGAFLRELFAKLRQRIPGLVLRTSVITGLPGESEAEFDELCQFLKDLLMCRHHVMSLWKKLRWRLTWATIIIATERGLHQGITVRPS
jgi:subtilisin family serine protease